MFVRRVIVRNSGVIDLSSPSLCTSPSSSVLLSSFCLLQYMRTGNKSVRSAAAAADKAPPSPALSASTPS